MEWTVKSTNAQTGMMIQKQLLMGWVSERAAQGPFHFGHMYYKNWIWVFMS